MENKEEKARVLVTGGTGFLGSTLIAALVRSKRYRIRALVRRIDRVSSEFDAELVASGLIEFVQGDIVDLQSLIRACDGCVGVFHVAAYVKPWARNPSLYYEVNVQGLKNVIQAAKSTESVKKLVYTSSFFALGPSKKGQVSDESQIHSGKNFTSDYERSKFEADNVARSCEFPTVLLYPGTIYGPGKLTGGNTIADMLIQRFTGQLPAYIGPGNERLSFCHVEDVAAAHIAAFERGAPGERFILGGPNHSIKDVFDIAAKLTNTSKPRFSIPLWFIYISGYLSTFFARFTGAEPLITHSAATVLKRQWAYSSAKAEKLLGYKPRSLEEGLAEVLDFLKRKQAIKY